MKAYSVRMSFTDRKLGPGVGRTFIVRGSSLPIAMAKASKMFWKELDTKNRNDARRGGFKAEAREHLEVSES
jgi:hypothetical protein